MPAAPPAQTPPTRVETPATLHELAGHYSETRLRTVDAALDLFAKHGVSGTSLQMIADELGVTKAAIYHQFSTKDAIVTAVVEVKLVPIEDALGSAELAGPTPKAREALLGRVIETVVSNRFMLSTMQSDPVLFRVLAEHDSSRHLWTRLFSFLVGRDLDAHGLVRAAVLSAAIGAVAHPFVLGLDDDELAVELLSITRSLIFI